MLDKKINSMTLVSPTARASQVLEKSTGRKAGTIHRTLESFEGVFLHNKKNPLFAQVLVCDETSMVDIYLFRSLLNALSNGCKLILVGDFAQLESIQTGNILNDIIESEMFPVIKLDKVFRQALDSGSLSAATDARYGIKFYDSESESLELGKDRDFRLWFGTKEDTSKRIAMVYKSCLKKWSVQDILVVVPMKKGDSGTNNLNNILQELANPQDGTKNQIELSFRTFRENDKVMHIKNDYNVKILDETLEFTGLCGIFNGDIGYVKKIIPQERLMYVDYDDKIIEYNSGNFDQIQLNYAGTVHKSQGGQSPVVIMGLDISGYMNLKRSLVYTGMTRCSKQLFLIAERRALNMAIANDSLMEKKTFLKSLLINYKKDIELA
jgi:RecD/TraA family predicted helicase